MKSKITLVAVAVAAIFTSCSKEVSFTHSGKNFGGYHKMEQPASSPNTPKTTVVAIPETVEIKEEALLTTSTTSQPEIIKEKAAVSVIKSSKVESANTKATESVSVASVAKSKKEVKAIAKQIKKDIKDTKDSKAEGKSQIVAAILAFFLGGLGIHRFYLGYTGKGILQLAMLIVGAVTAVIIVGLVILLALWIWVLIDFVRILTGGLKPQDGEYAKTL